MPLSNQSSSSSQRSHNSTPETPNAFGYKSKVRSLLGMPPETGGQFAYSPGVPLVGFRYKDDGQELADIAHQPGALSELEQAEAIIQAGEKQESPRRTPVQAGIGGPAVSRKSSPFPSLAPIKSDEAKLDNPEAPSQPTKLPAGRQSQNGETTHRATLEREGSHDRTLTEHHDEAGRKQEPVSQSAMEPSEAPEEDTMTVVPTPVLAKSAEPSLDRPEEPSQAAILPAGRQSQSGKMTHRATLEREGSHDRTLTEHQDEAGRKQEPISQSALEPSEALEEDTTIVGLEIPGATKERSSFPNLALSQSESPAKDSQTGSETSTGLLVSQEKSNSEIDSRQRGINPSVGEVGSEAAEQRKLARPTREVTDQGAQPRRSTTSSEDSVPKPSFSNILGGQAMPNLSERQDSNLYVTNEAHREAIYKIEQLRQTVQKLAAKTTTQSKRTDTESPQSQSVQAPPPIRQVVVIRQSAHQVKPARAFWERNYSRRSLLRPRR